MKKIKLSKKDEVFMPTYYDTKIVAQTKRKQFNNFNGIKEKNHWIEMKRKKIKVYNDSNAT